MASRIWSVAGVVLSGALVFSELALAGEGDIKEAQVVALVKQTKDDIAKAAKETFAKINKKQAPYVSAENPALYVFIYDKEINMVAHAQLEGLVGKNFKGKPDAKGKNFRDEIVTKALSKKEGWVDYIYQKPGDTGLFPKKTFFMLAKGSDGKDYIVCSGMYAKNK